jgi:dihydroorotate dehydrogenase electron transfer subunit
MIINKAVPITLLKQLTPSVFALRFPAPEISETVEPGQFLNLLVSDSFDPLLRRPYSISNVYGEECEILFAVLGKGTNILAQKKIGDKIAVLGPLGNSFGYEKKFSTAIILGGGIGAAPFPFLTRRLVERNCRIETFIGARTSSLIVTEGMRNIHVATDDGSVGFRGNAVSCLTEFLRNNAVEAPMIFACGPTPMLRAAQSFAKEQAIPCELSLESEMACGFGICQGCPIEHKTAERKYALVCTDGPCFESESIVFKEYAG